MEIKSFAGIVACSANSMKYAGRTEIVRKRIKAGSGGLFAFILLLPFSPNSVIVEIVNFSVLTD